MTIPFLALVIAKSALLSSLGWLAWTHERNTGWDAFHLVPILAAGSYAIAHLESISISPALQIATPFIVAALCMAVGMVLSNIRIANDQTLVVTILIATVSLILFDAAIAYTPQTALSLPYASLIAVTAVTLVVMCLTWAFDRGTRLLALGEMNRWALRYWRSKDELVRQPRIAVAATYLSWVVALTVPLQSTGVLSSTVFRNVVFAVLLARVAAARGVPVLLATASTLAFLVTVTAFLVVSRYTPMLIEVATLAVLFIWAQRRTERTKWLNVNGR